MGGGANWGGHTRPMKGAAEMTFDEFGGLWLSDPWIAAVALMGIVAAVLWSHGWIVTGAAPRPRTMAVRVRRDSRHGVALLTQVVHAARPSNGRRGTVAPVVHIHRQRRSRTAA